MNAVEQVSGIDPDLKTKIQAACERVAQGVLPTMDQRRAAAAVVDRMRDENARIHGVQDVTLDAVRESRQS